MNGSEGKVWSRKYRSSKVKKLESPHRRVTVDLVGKKVVRDLEKW